MKQKFSNELCNNSMTFQDCELAILRNAVDNAEKVNNSKIPNSEKIKSRLGWSPTKNADEVISEVVDFYRQDDLYKKF